MENTTNQPESLLCKFQKEIDGEIYCLNPVVIYKIMGCNCTPTEFRCFVESDINSVKKEEPILVLHYQNWEELLYRKQANHHTWEKIKNMDEMTKEIKRIKKDNQIHDIEPYECKLLHID